MSENLLLYALQACKHITTECDTLCKREYGSAMHC